MERTTNRPAKALNLQIINDYLTFETSAAYVAHDLDKMLYDVNYMYGQTTDCCLTANEYSELVYNIMALRNLFANVAIANGEADLETLFYWQKKCFG